MTGAPNHDPIDGKRIDAPMRDSLVARSEPMGQQRVGAHVGPSGAPWSTEEAKRRVGEMVGKYPLPRWARKRDVEIVGAFLTKRSEDAERWLEEMHGHGMNPDAIDRAESRAMDCAEAIGAFKRIVEGEA